MADQDDRTVLDALGGPITDKRRVTGVDLGGFDTMDPISPYEIEPLENFLPEPELAVSRSKATPSPLNWRPQPAERVVEEPTFLERIPPHYIAFGMGFVVVTGFGALIAAVLLAL